jgi:hypothetical protein
MVKCISESELMCRMVINRAPSRFGSSQLKETRRWTRVIAHHLGVGEEEYLAGLWRPRLALGLLWYAQPRESGLSDAEVLPGMPTWSWMSIGDRLWHGIHWTNDPMTPIEVIEAKTTLAGDSYGPVIEGFVKIKGPVCMVRISQEMLRDPDDDEERLGHRLILDDPEALSAENEPVEFLDGWRNAFEVFWDTNRGRTVEDVTDRKLCLLLGRIWPRREEGESSRFIVLDHVEVVS